MYGNKQPVKKGIINIHLNIRSSGKKIFEIRNIVNQHSPHVLGLSECEIIKVGGKYDESKLKVPGYNILLSKSWTSHGFARVIVYVRKTLEYEQIEDLVQSIWVKGGFKNSKKVYFSHCYREHTSTLGNSLSAQKSCLVKLLDQWKAATLHGGPEEPNETNICGDMNLDSLNDKWLTPE